MDDELEQLLQAAEEQIAAELRAVLDELSDEIAAELADATEIVAARFSLSRIARMWAERVPRIMRRLFRIAQQAGEQASRDVDATLPDDWNDLPARYDDGTLPDSLGQYAEATEHLLRAVGDRLTEAAVAALTEGLDAGEDTEQLRARLRALFAADGSQLGETREERIARTESTRAWNAATLAAARDLSGPDRPLVKQWQTRRDPAVRDAHDAVDGQLRLLDEPFTVAGVSMSAPGDPTAPANLTVNCFPGDTLVQAPSGVRNVFRRWYEGPLVEVHTEDGCELAGTPNHPLLTNAGWQPMERVQVGDQLVGAPIGIRVSSGDPDVEDRPTSLAELYRAAHEAGMPSGVIRGRVDFHGDVADSGVEVVSVHGDLRPDGKPARFEGIDNSILDGPCDRAAHLASTGHPGSASERHWVAGLPVRVANPSAIHTARLVRGGSQSSTLLEGEPLHAQSVCLAAIPDCDACLFETATDHGAADAESAREGQLGFSSVVTADDLSIVDGSTADAGLSDVLARRADRDARAFQDAADPAVAGLVSPHEVLERLAGHVALHDVIRVNRRWFRGHVYNLETEGGWYIANSIASHNCRCILRLQAADRSASFESNPSRAGGVFETQEATAAADTDEHTGAMIALVPSADDAERLALDDGEPVDELHCTLMYLGEADTWTDDQRNELIGILRDAVDSDLAAPVRARAFGVNMWNPSGDEPAWVYAVSDEGDSDDPDLRSTHLLAVDALERTHDRPEIPRPHSPWVAHVTAAYTRDTWPLAAMSERLGPITFDRLRLAFGGEYTDIPLGTQEEDTPMPETTAATDWTPPVRAWSTPGDAALAFIGRQTGDGRIFAEGSLYWEGGPWPLQYADEMGAGHDGAELAGAIQEMDIDGPRLTGRGVLYLTQRAGYEAELLLDQGAPLGVSVDLDDVSVELRDNTSGEEDQDAPAPAVAVASYARASVLSLHDGGWMITASSAPEWTASGAAMQRSHHTASIISGPGGRIPAEVARTLFPGALTAAAGDPDDPETGTVVHTENSGDFLIRITRARVRGATLVAMPAYDQARIVLDPIEETEETQPEQAPEAEVAAAAADDLDRVVIYVCSSPVPLAAGDIAQALGLTMSTVKRHLRAAVSDGRVFRIGRGLYTAPSSIPEGEVFAAASGDLGLPVHADRDAEWDGDAAASRVLEWATAEDGTVDPDRLGAAFLYRAPDADPATLAAYKLGYADVFSNGDSRQLEIVAAGVYAAGGGWQGARGGVDIPEDEQEQIREHVDQLYAALADAYDDPNIRPPWAEDEPAGGDDMDELEASAWQVMQQQPPMPAEWFREPTEEELPPGSGGVHYKDGRVYGWVAQAGVPHAVHGTKVQIEKLGRLDLSHFLRAKFPLDDGSEIAVGTITMNVGHHRDGWQCETAACQFDDSGTVAGIVTVGQNSRGLWFSGAAAPWLSEWDLTVFRSCQPSYHLTQARSGTWELRAVLSVPVPAHSSPLKAAAHLAATAVIERSNLALTAAAAALDTEHKPVDDPEAPSEQHQPAPTEPTPGTVLDDVAAYLTSPAFLDLLADAFEARQADRARVQAELDELSTLIAPALAASAAPLQEGH